MQYTKTRSSMKCNEYGNINTILLKLEYCKDNSTIRHLKELFVFYSSTIFIL